jgi:toxin ParE1/3/4
MPTLMRLSVRPEAKSDIRSVTRYIARDNPRAAERWFNDIYEKCGKLSKMPRMGVARPDIRSDLRTLPFGNYLIFYREIKGGVEIVRVLHGARDWENMF